jgi:hypothetical protein
MNPKQDDYFSSAKRLPPSTNATHRHRSAEGGVSTSTLAMLASGWSGGDYFNGPEEEKTRSPRTV